MLNSLLNVRIKQDILLFLQIHLGNFVQFFWMFRFRLSVLWQNELKFFHAWAPQHMTEVLYNSQFIWYTAFEVMTMADSILRDKSKEFAKQIVFLCRDIKANMKESVRMNFMGIWSSLPYKLSFQRLFSLLLRKNKKFWKKYWQIGFYVILCHRSRAESDTRGHIENAASPSGKATDSDSVIT